MLESNKEEEEISPESDVSAEPVPVSANDGSSKNVKDLDRLRVGWLHGFLCHRARRRRRVTYPESYITKYTTYPLSAQACKFAGQEVLDRS